MIKFVGTLPLESIVDVKGVLVEANVKSCTQVNITESTEYCCAHLRSRCSSLNVSTPET